MRTCCFLLVVFWMALAGSSLAASAVTCHCFSERALNPDRPKAVDAYLLTTTYNSFMATVLRMEKRAIVRAKMTGTPDEDIWMLHWSIRETGMSAEEVLRKKNRAGSWMRFILQDRLADEAMVTNRATDDQALAMTIAKREASALFHVSPQSLETLVVDGANIKEIVLACFLSQRTGLAPLELFRKSRSDNESWGMMAQSAGLDFTKVESEMKNSKTLP